MIRLLLVVSNCDDHKVITIITNSPYLAYSNNNWLEWVLAGKLNEDPICCPVNACVYKCTYNLGTHGYKAMVNPSCTETRCCSIPRGLSIIVDNVIENEEGEWLVVNEQSRLQLNIRTRDTIYVCLKPAYQSPRFSMIYSKEMNLH